MSVKTDGFPGDFFFSCCLLELRGLVVKIPSSAAAFERFRMECTKHIRKPFGFSKETVFATLRLDFNGTSIVSTIQPRPSKR
jgi:hypothetical protein